MKSLSILCVLALACISQAGEINWKRAKPHNAEFAVKNKNIKFSMIPGKGKKGTKVWYVAAPWKLGKSDANGISFEIKGNGSKNYASVFLGYMKYITNGYGAAFPLDSKQWKKVSIRFDDFVQNDKPWGVRGKMNINTLKLDPAKVNYLAFGRGNHFHKFYPKTCSFEIRDIKLEKNISKKEVKQFSKGLTRTNSLLKNNKPLNILLLGDSITDHGKDKSFAYYCGKMLTKKYGSKIKVANCGIGGHSVRGGTIVLPRSIRTMPNPDLVCIFYGANDCKAANGESGFNAKTFQLQIEKLIDGVRIATDGKADILVINGVPRLDKKRTQSLKIVENIADGSKAAASAKQAAFLDTLSVFAEMSQDEWNKYYKDTIHQNASGLEFIGKLMYNKIINL